MHYASFAKIKKASTSAILSPTFQMMGIWAILLVCSSLFCDFMRPYLVIVAGDFHYSENLDLQRDHFFPFVCKKSNVYSLCTYAGINTFWYLS
jgi:hypothetical protein